MPTANNTPIDADFGVPTQTESQEGHFSLDIFINYEKLRKKINKFIITYFMEHNLLFIKETNTYEYSDYLFPYYSLKNSDIYPNYREDWKSGLIIPKNIVSYIIKNRWGFMVKDLYFSEERTILWEKTLRERVWGRLKTKYAGEGLEMDRCGIGGVLRVIGLKECLESMNEIQVEDFRNRLAYEYTIESVIETLKEQTIWEEKLRLMDIYTKIIIYNNKKWKGNIKNKYAKKIQMWWKRKLYNPHTELGKRFALKQIEWAFEE